MASLANALERYTNWIVLIFFLFSVNLTMEAGAYLLDDGAGDRLQAWAQWPARAGLVLVFVAMILARPLRRRLAQSRSPPQTRRRPHPHPPRLLRLVARLGSASSGSSMERRTIPIFRPISSSNCLESR